MLWRIWWTFVCLGFYMQFVAYVWADNKRNQVPPLTKLQRRLLIAGSIVVATWTAYALWRFDH